MQDIIQTLGKPGLTPRGSPPLPAPDRQREYRRETSSSPGASSHRMPGHCLPDDTELSGGRNTAASREAQLELVSKMVLWQREEKKEACEEKRLRETEEDLAI